MNVLLFPNKSILKVSEILETNKRADKVLRLHSLLFGDLFVTGDSFRAAMKQNASFVSCMKMEICFATRHHLLHFYDNDE